MATHQRWRWAIAVGIVAVLISGQSPAQTQTPSRALAVAAASDLQAVFPELASSFERDTGIRITTSFGSSGSFFAQIQNGAPFDVFFSADIDYPRQLVAAKLAEADSLYEYATGHLVLWTRKDSGVDVSRGLKMLTESRVRRIAIANPKLAPYGRAAIATLEKSGVYEAVKGKIVLGDNISQTAQLADSGNADVGILSLSLALGPALRASGAHVEIPTASHPPIQQAAVVVSASRAKSAARDLIAWLRKPEAGRILQQFGFDAPRSKVQ